jgi:hypothetical protein
MLVDLYHTTWLSHREYSNLSTETDRQITKFPKKWEINCNKNQVDDDDDDENDDK